MKELTKNAIRWGNGAGVLLPKEWVGKQVQILLVDRTLEIKKEVLEILDDYLEDILGVYLVGSYARGEQKEDSDIDVLAISGKTKKEIRSGKYHISITTTEGIKKTLEYAPILAYPRLIEAKALLNKPLLEELRDLRITKSSFKEFMEECKRIIKINIEFLELDKLDSEYLESEGVIYSVMLRLRGIFIIKSILSKKPYSNKKFINWMKSEIKEEEIEKAFNEYKLARDNKKQKYKLRILLVEKLLDLLEKEVRKYE